MGKKTSAMEGAKAKRTKVEDVRQEKGVVASIPSEFDMDYYLEDKTSRESQQLLKFLPEVVWILVMDQMSDNPRDLETLSNSSPFFRQLLIPRRALFLFPTVLHLTLPYFSHVHHAPGTYRVEAITKATNEMRKLFKCRLVCSSWNQSLDTYIQQCEEFKEYRQFHLDIQARAPVFPCTTFGYLNSNTLYRFLEHFESTHSSNSPRSPFIDNTFMVFFGSTRRPLVTQNLINETTTLLQKYGHHITRFGITLPNNDLPYLKLREWLLLVPNVKHLDIAVADEWGKRPMIVSAGKLANEIREYPLPTLHKLETLESWYIRSLPDLILNELIRANNPKKHGAVDMTATNFNSLVLRLQSFPALFLSPLASLEIIMPDMMFINLSDVFKTIQDRWGRTLRQLHLHLPDAGTPEKARLLLSGSQTFRLTLPVLRELKLRINKPVHLDFLLYLKDTLEILNIELCYSLYSPLRRRKVAEESFVPLVQFIGLETRLLESNIWTLFPNLKKVCVQNETGGEYKYCRQKWISLQ